MRTGAVVTPDHPLPCSGRSLDRQSPTLIVCNARFAGLVLRGELYPAPEPLTDEASKVGALPQTPPGAEPLDLNTCARFR